MSNTTVTRPARTTMHVIVQNRYGTSEVLHPAQIERRTSAPTRCWCRCGRQDCPAAPGT
jgi:hypothetical protein